MVGRRVRAGDDHHVCVRDVPVCGGHRPRADTLEEGGHRGRMAEPRAVVNVVGAEACPDELLEEVRLLVGALGGAEPGDGARAPCRMCLLQPARHEAERLVPARLAEVRQHLVVVDEAAGLAAPVLSRPAILSPPAILGSPAVRRALPAAAVPVVVGAPVPVAADVGREGALRVGGLDADEGHREALRRGGVVPAVAALHAQPALRAGLIPALGE